MVRRIQVPSIILCVLLSSLATAGVDPSTVLVHYSFDDDNLAAGPDTLRVFEMAKGTVNLTTAYRFSGYRSVEIRDFAGDGDFPELQGYFMPRERGKLFMHFAFMTADPHETLNMALAGPEGFTLRKNGIAFWLKTRDAFLCHYSDSIPKKLLRLEPLIWYVVDVAYDIDEGTYDLTIYEEQVERPIVSLTQQKNATNRPSSVVNKFSFIGDAGEDTSNVLYYVDDVIIGTDESVAQIPFVAPGRRKLFIDSWNEYYHLLYTKPGLPVTGLADLGIAARDLQALKEEGLFKGLEEVIAGGKLDPQILRNASPESSRRLQGITLWRDGSIKLAEGNAIAALQDFEKAARIVPEGRIYELSAVLSLAALGRWQDVDLRLNRIYPIWRDDQRFAIVSAMIGMARGQLDQAEHWLRTPAEQIPQELGSGLIRRLWSGETNEDLINDLREESPRDWLKHIEDTLMADQYYFVLLWKKRFDAAERYASRMAERLRALDWPSAQWLERAGDAAFYAGTYQDALAWYQESLQGNEGSTSVWLKLSDVHFQLGDLEKERIYREKIYGRLSKE